MVTQRMHWLRDRGRDFWRSAAARRRRQSEPRATDHARVAITVRVEADEDDGGFVASIVEVPGAWSQGESEHEAVSNAIDALTCVLQARMEEHVKAPHPATAEDGYHDHRLLLPV
jgi:predicted RNase H-like HicB family nuclease